jgi:hypothetical protein
MAVTTTLYRIATQCRRAVPATTAAAIIATTYRGARYTMTAAGRRHFPSSSMNIAAHPQSRSVVGGAMMMMIMMMKL